MGKIARWISLDAALREDHYTFKKKYLAYFLEWAMFLTEFVEKIKTCI
jgi:hypothetical protein